jgi:SAM-dependent methyltransferase
MPPLPPLQCSQAMEDLHFEHVIRKVKDSRTDWDENVSLGYPFDVIRDEVINKGRADFRAGHQHNEYGGLTADEKVLLYCFVNMKLHFFEALSAFRAYKASLKSLFDSKLPTRMVDLGCGPGTAGLALAECLKQPNVRYIGLDIAKAMHRKATSMLRAAIDRSLLGKRSALTMTSSWSNLRTFPAAYTAPTNALFNATYLFASDSLDVDDVCKAVMAYKDSAYVKRLLFVYSNTDTEISGEKFQAFKKKMQGEFTGAGQVKRSITYHKKRSSNSIDSTTFVRELMDFKGDV